MDLYMYMTVHLYYSPLTSHGPALAPLVADDDGLLVLPLPGDGRLGVASEYKLFREDLKKSRYKIQGKRVKIGGNTRLEQMLQMH